MAANKETYGAGFSFSALGFVIMSALYILQTQFNQQFVTAAETTLLVALVAGVGAILFYYGAKEDERI